MKYLFLLFICACAVKDSEYSIDAKPTPGPSPLNPKLPPNRYGPFVGRGQGLVGEYSFLSGFSLDCAWADVESVEGQFNFSSCEKVVKEALAQNKYVLINPLTGHAAPLSWLAEKGIPTVEVCFHEKDNSTCPKEQIWTYPYYLADNYVKYWKRYQQALHDWVKSLPKNSEGSNPVQSIQVSMGSTGDITPWHGAPLKDEYVIPGKVWKEFWVNGSAVLIDIYRDLLPDTKLLFNAVPYNNTPVPDDPDAKYWPAYRHLLFDVLKPPNFDVKYGVVSHAYFTTNELDDYYVAGNLTRYPFVDESGKKVFVRSRGESSDGNPNGKQGQGYWANPTWNALAMACWDITYGLDVWNPNPQMWSTEFGPKGYFTERVWGAFQHFHTHAGAKDVTTAPGAWIQLRDALDFSDTDRFPESEFGNATRRNSDRIEKIVEKFKHFGAGVDDTEAAMAGRPKSRARKGLNQVGWRIWPTNYGKWMKQIDPMTTSIGRWRIGKTSNLLGQNSRQTVPGKNMSFGLSAGLFDTKPGAESSIDVYIRVAFYDQGHGSWELHYRTKRGKIAKAAKVTKNNSLEFVELRIKLKDFACCMGEDVPALVLVDSDALFVEAEGSWSSADTDIFAWVEVMRSPFLYQMAEKVLDHHETDNESIEILV